MPTSIVRNTSKLATPRLWNRLPARLMGSTVEELDSAPRVAVDSPPSLGTINSPDTRSRAVTRGRNQICRFAFASKSQGPSGSISSRQPSTSGG